MALVSSLTSTDTEPKPKSNAIFDRRGREAPMVPDPLSHCKTHLRRQMTGNDRYDSTMTLPVVASHTKGFRVSLTGTTALMSFFQ